MSYETEKLSIYCSKKKGTATTGAIMNWTCYTAVSYYCSIYQYPLFVLYIIILCDHLNPHFLVALVIYLVRRTTHFFKISIFKNYTKKKQKT